LNPSLSNNAHVYRCRLLSSRIYSRKLLGRREKTNKQTNPQPSEEAARHAVLRAGAREGGSREPGGIPGYRPHPRVPPHPGDRPSALIARGAASFGRGHRRDPARPSVPVVPITCSVCCIVFAAEGGGPAVSVINVMTSSPGRSAVGAGPEEARRSPGNEARPRTRGPARGAGGR